MLMFPRREKAAKMDRVSSFQIVRLQEGSHRWAPVEELDDSITLSSAGPEYRFTKRPKLIGSGENG